MIGDGQHAAPSNKAKNVSAINMLGQAASS
jgi:hypothetical protein